MCRRRWSCYRKSLSIPVVYVLSAVSLSLIWVTWDGLVIILKSETAITKTISTAPTYLTPAILMVILFFFFFFSIFILRAFLAVIQCPNASDTISKINTSFVFVYARWVLILVSSFLFISFKLAARSAFILFIFFRAQWITIIVEYFGLRIARSCSYSGYARDGEKKPVMFSVYNRWKVAYGLLLSSFDKLNYCTQSRIKMPPLEHLFTDVFRILARTTNFRFHFTPCIRYQTWFMAFM